MRRKIEIAAAAAVLLSALCWKIGQTPEYVSYAGDSRSKCAVIVSLRHNSPWRAKRIVASLLKDHDAEVRRTAVACVGELGFRDLAPAVFDVLRSDRDVLVRAQALGALAKLGAEGVAVEGVGAEVLSGLADAEPDIRIASLQAAGRGVPVPDDRLLAALKDPDSRVREAALAAVSRLKLLRAVPILAEDLETERLFELSQTHEALQKITGANVGIEKEAWVRWYAGRATRE